LFIEVTSLFSCFHEENNKNSLLLIATATKFCVFAHRMETVNNKMLEGKLISVKVQSQLLKNLEHEMSMKLVREVKVSSGTSFLL
jgi:hypothetical protein